MKSIRASITGAAAFMTAMAPAVALAADGSGRYSSVDTLWVIFGACLVFFMQPGFAMVESGLTRAKNAGNIAMKNFSDLALGSIFFWIIGFSLMFGDTIGGFIGTPDFFFQHWDVGEDAGYPAFAYLIFQTVFCATSATILSGALAERTKFSAYLIISALLCLVVYPVTGHWTWGGGWLADMGFHDFAGSTVVHMVGGVASLVGAYVLGPRIGKYNADGTSNGIPGHNLTLAGLGVFILWFGWFGFNGASTVCATGDDTLVSMGSILVNTNMAPAVAAVTAMFVTWARYGKPDVSMTMNGALAGLVGITAGCDMVSIAGSFAIGLISGIIVVFSVEFFDQKLHIDDPVGAISVHGACGAAGTILTGVFALDGGLLYSGSADMLLTQIIGVAATAAYVFVAMGIVFYALKATVGVRVTKAEEIAGLDATEHNLSSAYAGFMTGDAFEAPIPVGEASEEAKDMAVEVSAAPAASNDEVIDTKKTHISCVTIITSEERFERLKVALERIGITGMTVTRVLGYGIQKGHGQMYRGAAVASKLVPKVQIDIVVSKIAPAAIINVAKKVLYTGHYGDGKIFVHTMDNVVKIRTGEEGFDALQDKPLPEGK